MDMNGNKVYQMIGSSYTWYLWMNGPGTISLNTWYLSRTTMEVSTSIDSGNTSGGQCPSDVAWATATVDAGACPGTTTTTTAAPGVTTTTTTAAPGVTTTTTTDGLH
jgi:hypothetical protein